MIHRNTQTLQVPAWQNTMNQAIRDPDTLFALLDLPLNYLPAARQAAALFPLRVPLPYLRRMKIGDIRDPLLRQILPLDSELQNIPGYQADPVGDQAAEKLPGLIHKYHGRVLLTLTGACGIHCRYCFRRHFDYQASNPTRRHWDLILDYLRDDVSIKEVILSGGDPLSLSDQRLSLLIKDLERIPHLRFLRIHTRQPVVIPERVNDELLSWLNDSRFTSMIVLHINHAQEIDENLEIAISRIKSINVGLLNQSVLLRGVNDSASELIALSYRLCELGIIPYYLHLLDRVSGAHHFEVDETEAKTLVEEMRQKLPGYLVPRLVREVAGTANKQPML